MEDKPVKRAAGGAAIAAVMVVVFLILPMIYLLAIGPIVWLHRRGFTIRLKSLPRTAGP